MFRKCDCTATDRTDMRLLSPAARDCRSGRAAQVAARLPTKTTYTDQSRRVVATECSLRFFRRTIMADPDVISNFSPLTLIEEVKKRPGLYEPDHPRDRLERLKLWKEVGAALFPNWDSFNKATMYHAGTGTFVETFYFRNR